MKEHILVVDDDPQLRQLMQWALEDRGHEVRTAADGGAALESIGRALPRCVVLDMGLPVVDGFGVAAALRPHGVPIVMVTADGSAKEKAARIGAFTFLSKPFELAALVARVDAALGGA